jgi:hypothetical protein
MTERRQDKRTRQGRHAESSAGTLDSQRVKAATQGSEVGCDGNKNITGCKRYLLVDTLGLIGAVVVTAANGDDRQGLMILLRGYDVDRVTRLRQTGVDSGYRAEWLRPGVWGLPCPPRALGRWWSIRARGVRSSHIVGWWSGRGWTSTHTCRRNGGFIDYAEPPQKSSVTAYKAQGATKPAQPSPTAPAKSKTNPDRPLVGILLQKLGIDPYNKEEAAAAVRSITELEPVEDNFPMSAPRGFLRSIPQPSP